MSVWGSMVMGMMKDKTDENVAQNKGRKGQFFPLLEQNTDSRRYIKIAMISLVIALISLLYLFYSVPRYNALNQSLANLKLLSQTISRQATDATSSGSVEAMNELTKSKDQFADHLQVLNGSYANHQDFKTASQKWKTLSKDLSVISSKQPVLNQLFDTNQAISESIPKVQADYNQMVELMKFLNLSTNQIIIAKNQVFLAERSARAIESLLNGSEQSKVTAKDFAVDTETFGIYLDAQLNGSKKLGIERIEDPQLRDALMRVRSHYERVLKPASALVTKNAAEISQVKTATGEITNLSKDLLNSLSKITVHSGLHTIFPALLLVFALAFFVFNIFRIFMLQNQMDEVRVTRLQTEYDRNQNAILRLLDEIADLADGDLRAYATVSEDFTGAIADSINFAIEQLRELVSKINETSQEIARYSQGTQDITNQLADASEHQAQEIAGASIAINEIVQSIDHVSTNATESAEVAQKSVEIAANGADVVNRSIDGMNVIREQIQETAKRIKRLGESSQEIGNIVALINDIADQTNILALNAAIQASMAGDAGRGFAVVADEVQRLAERSTSATKQIETLVKTIQTDTIEAVTSMEHTTSEVVRGANLAKDAGVALDEIQNVSNDLAKLIANISDSAKLQSASAGHIAHTMNVVQEITAQTTGATFDTARSVAELANMADTLRQSVSDFKLPEQA